MKGNVVDIYKAFDGVDKKLVIPVYQRNYDWTAKQCERLFDDLAEMIQQGRPKHFFGAVVGNPEDSFTWVVIDGQQRMTTVSLLMLALVHALEAGEVKESADDESVLKDGSSRLAKRLVQNYLTVAEGDEQKFKLKPVKDDAKAYARLFGEEEQFIEESKITVAYRYFRKRLRETELSAMELWSKGICQLEVMLLDLEPHDDPQRIFESLNSTGLALKESDKIRNLVLMGLPHQEQVRLYENYWNPMELNVDFQTDRFIRWYLVAQTSKTPRKSDVFDFFKRFVTKGGIAAMKIVEDMYAFSEVEKELSSGQTGYRNVDRRLRQANHVLGDVVKPFLWLCYRDMKNGEITSADFTRVVTIVESYSFRRVVASVAANALNKIFANAYTELRKLRKNSEPYSEILAYMLEDRGQSGRFPDDGEFAEAFRNRDFYNMRSSYRAYVFNCLEIGESKDVKDIAGYIGNGDLTIEHIMPQTLTPKWREVLGSDAKAIHEKWVNRIANLTITGYNSEYSNRLFAEKKKMDGGFSKSPYHLNSYVKSQDTWGPEQLETRAELLVDQALETWQRPEVTFVPPATVLPSQPLGTDKNFTGKAIAAVEVEGSKTTVTTWGEALAIVLSELLSQDREGVLGLVSSNEGLLVSRQSMAEAGEDPIENASSRFSTIGDNDAKKRIVLIDPALGVRIHNSTSQKVALMRRVCEGINFDPEEIIFYLRRTNDPETVGHSTHDGAEPEAGPYAELTALIPQVDEVVGSTLAEQDTEELRNDFGQRIKKYLVENPQEALGGKSLEDFLTNKRDEQLTADEALAGLSMITNMASMMGRSILHRALLDGQLSSLLKALV